MCEGEGVRREGVRREDVKRVTACSHGLGH